MNENTEPAALDHRRLVRNLGEDEDAARRVLDQFARQSQAALAELRAASRAGELHSMRQAAHKLKGALLWITAERAAAVAASVESLAASGEAERATQLLASLEGEVRKVVAAIEGIGGPPAG